MVPADLLAAGKFPQKKTQTCLRQAGFRRFLGFVM
jgi:hypothetical protein